jgi:eukaryotic-like serine/threonine-protein kinase
MSTAIAANTGNEGFKDVQVVATLPKAKDLSGITILNRWELIRLLHEGPQESGGNFGVGYVARDKKDGVERFVKIVDYMSRMTNPLQLSQLLQMAHFEVVAHKACLRMSKVVRMIDNGSLVFEVPNQGGQYSFMCLILELGEGDIKGHVDFRPDQSTYWKLWVLREIALATVQIQRGNLAHNDIKPSNVIRFPSKGDAHDIKLGDVGRVVTKAGSGPFDGLDWAGDPRHKPLEVLFGWREQEWQNRRTAADAYMLGNLACFLFIGASLTERVVNSLPPELRPLVYKGNYLDIMDVVRHVWSTVLNDQVIPLLPAEVREELGNIIRWLTDPNPTSRGEPAARRSGTVGIDRIQSHLERLAHRARIHERVTPKK